MLRRRLAAALDQHGRECLCFERAEALLHYLARAESPQAAVVDCLLPDMDIFGFLGRYRQLCARGGHLLIVTCTETFPARKVRSRILSNGADYYMIKPYTAQALLENIEQLRFPPRRVWDPGVQMDIVTFVRRLGLEPESLCFWYLASSIQFFVTAAPVPVPLKSLYIELGRIYSISPKGIESGLRRAGARLAGLGVFSRVPSTKHMLAVLVREYLRQSAESGEGDYALVP